MYNNGDQTSVKERVSNLDKILNYEKYLGNGNEETVERSEVETAISSLNKKYGIQSEETFADSENITPSTTTMQFREDEDDGIYEDVGAMKVKAVEKTSGFTTKSKVLVVVYALVVNIIIALIILNSRMLKALDTSLDDYSTRVTKLNEEYVSLTQELEYVSSDDVIISKAEEIGMIKA